MFEYGIYDHPDREDLFAELVYDNHHVGEISITDDKKSLRIQFFKDASIPLDFPAEEFIRVVTAAHDHLARMELPYWADKRDLP